MPDVLCCPWLSARPCRINRIKETILEEPILVGPQDVSQYEPVLALGIGEGKLRPQDWPCSLPSVVKEKGYSLWVRKRRLEGTRIDPKLTRPWRALKGWKGWKGGVVH